MPRTSIRPLPDDLQKVAIAELNEVPERIADDLEELKIWIQQQPHLRARSDDQFLLAFLRGCKFNMKKTKSKIDHYYTFRTKYPDFYTIQDLENPRIKELIRLGIGLHLPTPLNENGPRIMIIRIGAYPAKKFSMDEIMCLAHTMEEVSFMEDDYAVVNGYVDIMDLSRATTAHMLKVTPNVIKKMYSFQEKSMPLRQKAIHFINVPFGFHTLFNMLKPLMPAKQKERIFVHGRNLETLHKHIPQKYLPKEYGGENGSIDSIIKLGECMYLKYNDFFKEGLKYGTDESLRVSKTVDSGHVFGINFSLRKTEID